MRLILLRHGETDWNREGRSQGTTDNGLNARGRRQAAELARALRAESIVALYSSPLRRALETAALVAEPHGLPVLREEGLRELDQGELEGMTPTQIETLYPGFLAQWREDAASVRIPGGESLPELQERAWASIRRIAERHPKGVVVAVGHNLTNRAILCRVLRLALSSFRSIGQAVATMNVLEFRDGRATLALLNDTCHLAGLASRDRGGP